MSAYSMKCVSKRIHSRALHLRAVDVCVHACVCVRVCVKGADTDRKGECQGQGQSWETLFTMERWGRWESEVE